MLLVFFSASQTVSENYTVYCGYLFYPLLEFLSKTGRPSEQVFGPSLSLHIAQLLSCTTLYSYPVTIVLPFFIAQ